ncbi:MAG: response regulator [Lachnospiraceae bacterium]|nr:response regulator [Lachnospiraceae bacterium]
MTIVLVSDDKAELKLLEENVALYYPDDLIIPFNDAKTAMQYVEGHLVDVCFTSVVMKKVSGIAIAKEIKKSNPDVLVNFIADDETYALEAWRLHINDYIVRPINGASIAHTLRDF